jgi:hypothetical protein
VCLATAFTLSACGAGPEPWPSAAGPDEAPPASVEQLIAPTPAMLAAALTGDPVKMQAAAATQSSCHAASTCPAAYGSCSSWSAFSQCDATCTESSICTCPPVIEHPDDPPPEPCVPDLSIRRGRMTSNSFRVCFNSVAQACTEWKQAVSFSCGC